MPSGTDATGSWHPHLADAGALTGRVLDAGCGTGEHTLMATGLGLDATGIDLAATALRIAEKKARQRGLTARFLHWDVLRLDSLGESFADGWRVASIEPATLDITTSPSGVRAWMAAVTRT